ncbi:MAG: L-serine ammonia-lyase, iron-sulfur-dependent subunit beta [Caldisericia bacterium]|nr:L-serine ammonia-lyase, iron-sulfur-dependent subunit beta [Caldisericia bacterium]MDD4614586.1 L-serine ammonia-lyase, iron-sulfur-dependent subunit beta [Caldisericia bacterium]
MAIFDIIGPVMIGPSSSHTAGANRIGYMAALCYGSPFHSVEIKLYNSFASTGFGHGTDRAIVAGLLGFKMDDERIPHAFEIAKKRHLSYNFRKSYKRDHHPNEVRIVFNRGSNHSFLIRGVSIGAGKAKITQVQDDDVEFGGDHAILLLNYQDITGMIGFIGGVLGKYKVNVAYMKSSRNALIGTAMAMLKLDEECPQDAIEELKRHSDIHRVISIRKLNNEY